MLVSFARLLHVLSLIAVASLGVAALGYTLLCAMGLASWLSLSVTLGDITYPDAGFWVQIGGTLLLASLMTYLPTNARIVALEVSHRNFHITMDDVARAYHLAHTADRRGVFSLSSEFDAVRERLAFLRDHPDLEKLEHEIIEVAAQMSQQARELADIYSDEKVARAKSFLTRRQTEAEAQQERITQALHVIQELRSWSQQVEAEEAAVASQLAHLDEKLQAILPALGYTVAPNGFQSARSNNVVNLATKTTPDLPHFGPDLQRQPAAE